MARVTFVVKLNPTAQTAVQIEHEQMIIHVPRPANQGVIQRVLCIGIRTEKVAHIRTDCFTFKEW